MRDSAQPYGAASRPSSKPRRVERNAEATPARRSKRTRSAIAPESAVEDCASAASENRPIGPCSASSRVAANPYAAASPPMQLSWAALAGGRSAKAPSNPRKPDLHLGNAASTDDCDALHPTLAIASKSDRDDRCRDSPRDSPSVAVGAPSCRRPLPLGGPASSSGGVRQSTKGSGEGRKGGRRARALQLTRIRARCAG
jgi:hypothetical protein